MPKRSGSTPAVAKVTKRPSGVRPAARARSADVTMTADGAVARLRRVAGRHAAGGVERRPQLRERFGRRVAPRPFVDGEDHLPRARSRPRSASGRVRLQPDLVDQRRRHRHDLVGEAAAVDRGDRALMAAQREGVLLLARDPRLARVVLGDEAGA